MRSSDVTCESRELAVQSWRGSTAHRSFRIASGSAAGPFCRSAMDPTEFRPWLGWRCLGLFLRGCRCQPEMTSNVNIWWCMTMSDSVWLFLYTYIYSYRLIDMVYGSLLYTLTSVMPLWFQFKHHLTLAKVFRQLGLLCLFKVIRWEFHSWKPYRSIHRWEDLVHFPDKSTGESMGNLWCFFGAPANSRAVVLHHVTSRTCCESESLVGLIRKHSSQNLKLMSWPCSTACWK